jgi:hypothetical protein
VTKVVPRPHTNPGDDQASAYLVTETRISPAQTLTPSAELSTPAAGPDDFHSVLGCLDPEGNVFCALSSPANPERLTSRPHRS